MRRGAQSHWRKLDFFDKKDWSKESENKDANLITGIDVSCCSAGNGVLVFASSLGDVSYFRKDKNLVRFESHNETIEFIVKSKTDNKVLVIGRDRKMDKNGNTASVACLKIWLLNQQGKPRLKLELPIFSRMFPEEVFVTKTIDEVFQKVNSPDRSTFFNVLNKAGVKISEKDSFDIFRVIDEDNDGLIDIMDIKQGFK
eukprot:UN28980